MVGGLTAKADAHYKRDVSSILPIPESPQGVQALAMAKALSKTAKRELVFLATRPPICEYVSVWSRSAQRVLHPRAELPIRTVLAGAAGLLSQYGFTQLRRVA